MATRRWKGKAKQVTQVDTNTIANTWAQNDTITITCDGIDFVVTIGTLVTTAQVATTLKQAFNGETLTDTSASCSPTIAQGGAQAIPQMAEVVATVSSSVVSLTARTSGKPFTFSYAENTAGDGTATGTTATAATGKWFFSNADNWTGDTVPVDGDAIIFDSGNVDCRYGLSPAIQPGSVTVTRGYTGKIGLPEINVDNSTAPYYEYRTRYLTFDDNSTTCTYNFNEDIGSGSQMIRIDAGAGQAIFNVYNVTQRLLDSQPPILLLGSHASNALNVPLGDVGFAFFEGETGTLVGLRVGSGSGSLATVNCGDGTTLTGSTIDVSGGTLYIDSATATADIDIHSGGRCYITGTGAHASIDVQNGLCDYRSTGTITTLAIKGAGVFDRRGDLRAATITNAVNMHKGATLLDPNKSLTFTAGITADGCGWNDLQIDLGPDRTYAIT